MTDLIKLANKLKKQTAWQRTPEEYTDEDYLGLIIDGVETLYIDTGRASLYSEDMIVVIGENEEEEFSPGIYFTQSLPIDEQKYVLIVAQILFFKQVQTDVNNIVGYTTDALTVTNADKPYAHLQDTITNLENERRIVFYKMVNYSFYQG